MVPARRAGRFGPVWRFSGGDVSEWVPDNRFAVSGKTGVGMKTPILFSRATVGRPGTHPPVISTVEAVQMCRDGSRISPAQGRGFRENRGRGIKTPILFSRATPDLIRGRPGTHPPMLSAAEAAEMYRDGSRIFASQIPGKQGWGI